MSDRQPTREQVERATKLIAGSGLASLPAAAERVADLLWAADRFEIPWNDACLTADLLGLRLFPTAPLNLGVILLAWKRTVPLTTLNGRLRAQSAGTVRDLRRSGFIFRRDGEAGNWDFLHEGERCRSITAALDPSLEDRDFIKLSASGRVQFFAERPGCVMCGSTAALEVEHRTPVETALSDGCQTSDLILRDSMLGQAVVDERFQAMCRRDNLAKSSACKQCAKGEAIPLPPPIARLNDGRFVLVRGSSCVGCFYHDPTMTLRSAA